VVERLRVLPDDDAVLDALGAASRLGVDPLREALATAADAAAVGISGGRASRGEVVRSERGRVDVRAEGPGVLVAAVAWDRGWTARVDGREAAIVRVNHAEMGIPLAAGRHRVELRHAAHGLRAGLALCALGAAGLAGAFALARAHRRPRRPVDPSPSRVLA
jgi:hypothetical protein